jgi:hypothetical protein
MTTIPTTTTTTTTTTAAYPDQQWTSPHWTAAKADWPVGPWTTEPDKVQFVDPVTGYDCLLVRGPWGSWCGYVGVPPDHPLFGKGYNTCSLPTPCGEDVWSCAHCPDELVEVHGGVTFSGECAAHGDLAVDEDPARRICHVPYEGRGEVFWFGFDCSHHADFSPGSAFADYRRDQPTPTADPEHWEMFPGLGATRYWTMDAVRAETTRLAQQLAALRPTDAPV